MHLSSERHGATSELAARTHIAADELEAENELLRLI